MKYFSKLNKYKASNLEYDCETQAAFSYSWWQFVKRIDGLLVFNAYKYSPTTSRHQRKVRALLDKLGVTIDRVTSLRNGLQGVESLRELEIRENQS